MHYALLVVSEKGNYVLELNCFHQPGRNMFLRACDGPCVTTNSNCNSHLFYFVSFGSALNESVVLRKMSRIRVKVRSFISVRTRKRIDDGHAHSRKIFSFSRLLQTTPTFCMYEAIIINKFLLYIL